MRESQRGGEAKERQQSEKNVPRKGWRGTKKEETDKNEGDSNEKTA
jgi:hypothetical protein